MPTPRIFDNIKDAIEQAKHHVVCNAAFDIERSVFRAKNGAMVNLWTVSEKRDAVQDALTCALNEGAKHLGEGADYLAFSASIDVLKAARRNELLRTIDRYLEGGI